MSSVPAKRSKVRLLATIEKYLRKSKKEEGWSNSFKDCKNKIMIQYIGQDKSLN